MEQAQLKELLLQSLEHERGGIRVYEAALRCVLNEELKEAFQDDLDETRRHEERLLQACRDLGIDAEEGSPGRQIVGQLGRSLVQAIQAAQQADDPAAAQLVACECVVLAETGDHAHWQLIAQCAAHAGSRVARTLRGAEEVEQQEDRHFYHARGWARELWLQSLGLPAVLPPPEQRRHVTSAIGAARAQQQSAAQR